ncbi:electron transporter RnfB [Candidatus Woesearchaeota archaeon CG11_big_fil_rev_8_21_14_0_20_43_8]|nr:MAG: electron transporter RnfB [Candidatus Woesearchaeota archaeon CG11_big_fil_rev_8_21_14_0_20_43_8]PIO04883.1 MAG: electron transporter RnfB [Candidatus Woesearchaeota archaeon CG08_land_8_20_14_0_20_43_7]
MNSILLAGIIGGVSSFAIGIVLAYFAKKFAVHIDPKIKEIASLLPQVNCGACGFANCETYATAVASGKAEAGRCVPGGSDVAKKISAIIGAESVAIEKKLARVICAGGKDCKDSFVYGGIKTCKAAVLVDGGQKSCQYGCLGFGDCTRICPFDAIHMGDKGLPVVDDKKCTGCGKCVEECPLLVLELVPAPKKTWVMCKSKDSPAETRTNCSSGCIACRMCEKVCPVDAVHVNDNFAKIDYSKCIDCGECARKCPVKVIHHDIPKMVASISDSCIGCTICAKNCPVGAITGELKKKHMVDAAKCVGCGICVTKCPKKAIVLKKAK